MNGISNIGKARQLNATVESGQCIHCNELGGHNAYCTIWDKKDFIKQLPNMTFKEKRSITGTQENNILN